MNSVEASPIATVISVDTGSVIHHGCAWRLASYAESTLIYTNGTMCQM